ncbi:hypothetical protein ACQEVZ_60325 [Dactylosporangium sp. CA-152071]|uniref:hypothetical protein n=1 Tax=Dactylosporangium sp. CA-152071 TaxID=3239933 RepID=UPI003D8B59C3
MVDREFLWTDEGLAVARRRNVALEEVDQALHAPPGLRFERRIGDLLLVVMGMAGSARVVAVIREQMYRTTPLRVCGGSGGIVPIVRGWVAYHRTAVSSADP